MLCSCDNFSMKSKFVEFLKYADSKPIVGERIKRAEGLIFKLSYSAHKLIPYVFTGHSIKFGIDNVSFSLPKFFLIFFFSVKDKCIYSI